MGTKGRVVLPGQNWKIARPPLLFPRGSSHPEFPAVAVCCVLFASPPRLLLVSRAILERYITRDRGEGGVAAVVVGFPPRRVTLIDDHEDVYILARCRSNLTSCHNFFIPPTFHFYPPLSPHFSLFLIRTILSPVHSILFVQKSNCQVWGGSRRDE